MMRTLMLVALGAGVVAVWAPAVARADSYWELEHARAAARVGDPITERDEELLERYGCVSGSVHEFCERLRQRDRGLFTPAQKPRARRE